MYVEKEGEVDSRPCGGQSLHQKETTRREAVTLRRYPNDNNDKSPFWWQVYSKNRLIIYGHDAKRERKRHRPKTLGLDSGCVYGNGLTGYLLEKTNWCTYLANRFMWM